MTEQTVLEMVILFVSTGRGEMITEDTVIAASRELEAVWNHIRDLRKTMFSDQKIVVWFLEEVGTSLVTRDWRKPSTICDNVERIYKRWRAIVPAKIVEPYLANPAYTKPRDPIPKLNFRQFQRIRGQHPISQPTVPGPGVRVDDLTDIYLKMKEGRELGVDGVDGQLYWQTINNHSFLTRRYTHLDDSSSINDIVEEFRLLFDNEWKTSFKACQSSYTNYHTVKFLSHLVKDIYDVISRTGNAKKTVQKQRRDAMRSIDIFQQLDKNSGRPYKHDPGKTQQSEISIPLKYIKQNYFESHLRHVLVKFAINSSSCIADVELYVGRCVEVCWYMCIREPPLYLDFDLEHDADGGGLFQPFTFPGGRNTDRRTRVVVWPAVRLNKDGIILDRGWTMNF